ncbi:hypothetical protein QOZ88_12035 [Blastococcus sp. BMG 814]|uniref:Uncharacterized protein n=1 Tax=Blastococcus carthaginiensis TaxID=3050034 RepID=A0ABT9IE46_9ACTN|nr:hypothetical protein [Blastococcus carthaginiensis]MDP5183370.1 hypothetical protein [Blastococcus carthaginiensis]
MTSDHAAGRDQATGRAHAVLRSTADLPAPWAGICGASVGVVQGVWDGPRGRRSADPCPECVQLTSGS